jgi:acyl-CoA thioesterase-2
MLPVLEQLTLASDGAHRFTAPASFESHVRTYGGQLAAQALLATSATVAPDRPCHSLHAYFLRPGDTNEGLQFEVDNVRDGRSFSVRQVSISQHGKHLVSAMASFHVFEGGTEHQQDMPSVPDPESLPTFAERFAGRDTADDAGRWFDRARAFDLRFVEASALDGVKGPSRYWVRFTGALPNRAAFHQAVIAYVTDMFILDPILLEHGRLWTDDEVYGATLDHTMWFHREFDATQWLLLDQQSSVAAHSRGLARSQIWTREGTLVATFAQEALLRPPYSGAGK